jgi:hypothetical protein
MPAYVISDVTLRDAAAPQPDSRRRRRTRLKVDFASRAKVFSLTSCSSEMDPRFRGGDEY